MDKVFISHSSRDVETVNKIQRALGNAGITPLLAEFEQNTIPPYEKIDRMMNEAQSVFLLLTENVKFSDYTQNWISYEVGLARGLGKDVCVFQKQGSYIIFPIPYLTDFFLYNPLYAKTWEELKKKTSNLSPSHVLGRAIVAELLGCTSAPHGIIISALTSISITEDKKKIFPIKRLVCHVCGIRFNYYGEERYFNCPSCCSQIEII